MSPTTALTPTAAPPPRRTHRKTTRAGTNSGVDLHSRVVEDVGQRIVNGELATGEILFADQLCEQLQISRSVVREGLRTLSSLGMVQSRPQRGTRVLALSNWDLLSPYIIRWRGQSPGYMKQMHELLELRLGIERAAAYFATTRMTADDIAAMAQAAAEMRTAFDGHDTFRFFRADAEMHRILLEGSGNAVMAQFADTVAALLGLRGGVGARIYTPHGISRLSMERHVALVDAIAKRERDAATELAEQIILATIDEVEALPGFGE